MKISKVTDYAALSMSNKLKGYTQLRPLTLKTPRKNAFENVVC